MILSGGGGSVGGFKDFEKLLNGGVKEMGVGTKYKREETKLGLL